MKKKKRELPVCPVCGRKIYSRNINRHKCVRDNPDLYWDEYELKFKRHKGDNKNGNTST